MRPPVKDLNQELDRLIERHYYSEDWELQGAYRGWIEALAPEDRDRLPGLIRLRCVEDPSIVNACLAAAHPFPGLDEPLAVALGRVPEPDQLSRALIAALRLQAGSDAAFRAVERFADSSQEMEALHALAAIDFTRAFPHLRRALGRDDLLETCLHLFADRRRTAGLPQLLKDLRAIAGEDAAWFIPRLHALLRRIKTPNTHPLAAEDQEEIARAFPGA